MDIEEGDILTYERTFTEEDIRQFADVSGDMGAHHVERDDEGRLMAQGLLTATLPTKIGGELNYVARTLDFEFVKPVYAGDTVTCDVEITRLEPGEKRTRLASKYVCRNGDGDAVLRGESDGMIPGKAAD
ncbi:MaoC/PaaZ C-terminal domain-containing protein [Haloarchaeobius amylolyticus]|uniref:MaoC/PaaZ C-terminal domain-containing protein n=1 Tax=Haloarchaeobius amylolyticus TaxID=1198296 RepID=UPI00226EE3CA|nr:MaoC/PaaZ C-terminal domain-containing protein [Haloarchaeobius amylolyticus]